MNQVNILMLGGKRCGKTTVLASMCGQMEKAVSASALKLSIKDPQTEAELARARYSIQSKMNDFSTPLTRVEVDDNPTSAKKTYSFVLNISGSHDIPFKIHDIPGEWLVDDHQEEVRALVKECQVIIIAIDTPYLFSKMTSKGYGIYHEEYNKPLEIANFFKNSLSVDNITDRMILFVPIKCERYYHLTHCRQLNIYQRDYMQELVDAISDGYQDLLDYLRSTPALMNSCTMAITPILSAGGIDFVRFRRDEQTGKMVSLYQQPEFLQESEQGYQPRFCEQPLIYSLIYILNQAIEAEKNRSGFMKAITFSGLKRPQMEAALETLRKKIKRSAGRFANDGYYFIQNPKNI